MERSPDTLGVERPVALDGHERVVADALALPERLHRHQNEIGAAKGQPADARRAHALRRQM
jgi:hypothetical protein